MSTGSINSLSSSFLDSILTKIGVNSASSASSSALQPDSGQLSPFAQLVSKLQQLQQSDPAKFKQVTQQIATNLTAAAQSATAQGNTGAATQLTQLATDFTNASSSGQLPNVQDLAQAIGGGGHHHHHHAAAASSSDAGNQLLSALETSSASSSSASLDPAAIILNTLQNAG